MAIKGIRQADWRAFGRLLLTATALTMSASSALRAAEPTGVSAQLLRMTEAFSDAGQRGDGAAMAAMLDDNVVFFNENGDRATKADIAASTPGPANPNVTTKMTVMDWDCKVYGDVAVASFVDDQKRVDHGEVFHARYRSVETWRRGAAGWRMIGSETIALHDDPPAIALSAKLLEQYAGTYVSAGGQKFTFARAGDHLVASLDGGPPAAQQAEVADVIFTPGRARTKKVFERGPNGEITGFSLRREGHDTHFRRV